MTINAKETDIMINSIQKNVDKVLQRHKKEITNAYEQMQDMGGLPISIGIKLQGNSVQIKSVVNLSFPIDKFKMSLKETIELKQEKIPFPEEPAKKREAPRKAKAKAKAKAKK